MKKRKGKGFGKMSERREMYQINRNDAGYKALADEIERQQGNAERLVTHIIKKAGDRYKIYRMPGRFYVCETNLYEAAVIVRDALDLAQECQR